MFRTVCSAFQNLRLGVIKLLQMIIASKKNPTHHMLLLSFVSSCKVYPSQTKILDVLTKDEIQIFDIHFKGVSTRFGLRTIAKYIEKSGFHLLSILPKSSFGEHKVVTKVHSIPENLTYRITCCYYLLLASCKVVTKDHSMPENLTHRITCCYYLLYHLAKFIPPKRRFGRDKQKMKS